MQKQVDVGQRYRDCTATWVQWQVERIYHDLLGLPHAIVSSLAGDMEQRTIACPILLDRRRFEPLNAEPEVAQLSVAGRVKASFVATLH